MKPTNEQIEKYRKIVADAPEGATHFESSDRMYYKYLNKASPQYKNWFMFDSGNKNYCWVGDMYVTDLLGIECLDNLRTIIALWDENHQLECDMDADHQHMRSSETQLQTLKESIPKIKADAVREAADTFRILNGASISDLLGYADKLERGE